MKLLLPLFLLAAFYGCSVEERPMDVKSDANTGDIKEVAYDSLLAQKYGADQYGMRRYVMAFLKRGPNRPTDETKAKELQAAHMANIRKMAEEGKLSLAGPFINDGDLRGIYIFNVETLEEARALTETDPAIQHGSLVMELHPWYGSAAVVGINEVHQTLSKTKM